MQEEVENRTVNLAISTTKLTARTLLNAFQTWRRYHKAAKAEKEQKAAEKPVGKQTIKELVGQNQGVSSIPIEKTGIRDFEQIARKYGIDYAVTKDKNVTPPKYTVFFKARDADAMTAAFTEYSNKKMKVQARPSVLKQLKKLMQLAASVPDRVRQKSQERDGR